MFCLQLSGIHACGCPEGCLINSLSLDNARNGLQYSEGISFSIYPLHLAPLCFNSPTARSASPPAHTCTVPFSPSVSRRRRPIGTSFRQSRPASASIRIVNRSLGRGLPRTCMAPDQGAKKQVPSNSSASSHSIAPEDPATQTLSGSRLTTAIVLNAALGGGASSSSRRRTWLITRRNGGLGCCSPRRRAPSQHAYGIDPVWRQ